MSFVDQIYISQILYTVSGYPVIVIGKTDETITVRYKDKDETRNLTIIGSKLFIVPPIVKNTANEKPTTSTHNSKSASVDSTKSTDNCTDAFVREIIYGKNNETRANENRESRSSNELNLKNKQKLIKRRKTLLQQSPTIDKSRHDSNIVNNASYRVQMSESKEYDYKGNFKRTIDINKTAYIQKPRVRGGWIADYSIQSENSSSKISNEGIERSAEFSRETKFLGKNSGYTGTRPSTITGYSQESRRPYISPKHKRR